MALCFRPPRTRSSRRGVAVSCLLAVGCGVLLAYQLRDVAFGDTFADVRVGWLLLAVAATAASLLAAAHNLAAFAPLRLRARDTLRTQLAVCGLRVVAPSAVSTPAISARYLTRRGLGIADALAVVATAQAAQLGMTTVVVAVIAATGATGLHVPGLGSVGFAVAGGALVVVTAVIVARRVPAMRRPLGSMLVAMRLLGSHLRRRPARVVGGLLASAALTITHVVAFACCVRAVGGDAAILTLTTVYLGAASAGSLVPTPAGVGAVEAAMIAGLSAGGLATGTAAGAALLTRLVTVWAPAGPGWWALRSLRRRGLL